MQTSLVADDCNKAESLRSSNTT